MPARVLILVSLVAAGCGGGPDAPALAENGVAAGPMVGFGGHHEVALWVHTLRPGQVRVRYWPEDAPQTALRTPAQPTAGEDGRVARVQVRELSPGTRYAYEIEVDGTLVPRGYPLRFQTQPLWVRRAEPPAFTVALGSCAYINDARFEVPGKEPYGGLDGHVIFERLTEAKPDLMLWLGDNIYLRETDWTSRNGIFRRYRHDRALPVLQPLLGSVHHYATWDDHDYGPNDADRSFSLKGDALDAFRENWLNPSYGLPETAGVFGQFTWGDVDFFLIDNRYHRASSHAPRDADKAMLGAAQLQWLIDGLTTSKAPFKIVAGGGQVLSPFDLWEGYAQHPHERDQLLDAIVERKIPGVVFLSGDRHHTELQRVQPEGSYPLYDFTSSPLTARPANPKPELNSPTRVQGTLLVGSRNFGLLKFSGPKGDRVMEMSAVDVTGAVRWTHTVKASELRVEQVKGSSH
jgi:alkaline phosphatase D